MTELSTARIWPFAIVEGRLLVAPDFLVQRGENDASIRRLLINKTTVDPTRGTALYHTRLTVPGDDTFALAYRYVPVPGGARDEATRRMHMVEGVICSDVDAAITEADLDRMRDRLLPSVDRHVREGWSGPPTPSHGEPTQHTDHIKVDRPAAPAGEVIPIPWWQRRPALLVLALLVSGGLALILLILRRLVSA